MGLLVVQEPVEEIAAPVRQRVQRSAPPPPRSPSPEEEPIFEKTNNRAQRAGMLHSNCRFWGIVPAKMPCYIVLCRRQTSFSGQNQLAVLLTSWHNYSARSAPAVEYVDKVVEKIVEDIKYVEVEVLPGRPTLSNCNTFVDYTHL